MKVDQDKEVFIKHAPLYDINSALYIRSDMSQQMDFPQEYPAFIQVHQEHPAMPVPAHWHSGPELIYSRNRHIDVLIDGKRTHVHPGGFVLMSSYAIHAIEPEEAEEPQDVLSISFQAQYLERMMPELRSSIISRDAPSATTRSKAEMVLLCEKLREQIEHGKAYFELNQILFSILHLIYTDFLAGSQEAEIKQLNMRNKMLEVLDYLKANYRQPLTTQSVSEHFGYTREYFCRLFRQYGDQPFKQYLTSLRLAAAVQELVSTDKNIGTIALDHGFPDEKSFFNAFKKRYKMTPNQYRRNCEHHQK